MAYAGLPLSVAMTLVVYAVFTGFVLRHFPGASTHAWGGTLIAVAVLRYALWSAHRSITREEQGHRRWPWRGVFIVGTIVAGASWATGPVLLAPGAEPAAALLLALVVLAVGAVSIATHAPDWHALLGFNVAAFLPTVTVLGFADDELVQLGAGVMLASMLTLIVIGRRSSHTTRALVESELRSTELDRMKSAFLGMASHELRTPMTGILGYSELVRESPELPEALRGWVNTINNEALRLQLIVGDLLNVSRIEDGLFDQELEPVSLVDCVATALRSYEGELVESDQLVVDVDDRLQAIANPQRLLEVVENLISNAVKYSPDGGQITISASAHRGRVCLSVRDTGLGIPAEALPSLFDRFQRIDSPDRSQIRGTGLGLYIVKKYVDSFDGDVGVESVEGAGSTFSVTLRRARDLAQAA